MPGPSKFEIRIVVKTDTSRTSDGQTCVVDTSKGLPSLLEAVSSQVDFEVEELSLLSFKEHVVVTSSITNPKFLRDLDIVLAIPSDEAATPKQKFKGRNKKGVQSSGPRRQIDEDSSDIASRSAGSSKKRKGRDGTTPMYSVGTKVRKKFDGHGWFEGSIISVSKKSKSYKVEYDDGDEEEYFFDEREIDKIVQQAEVVELEDDDDDDASDAEASRMSKSKKKRKTSSGTKAKYGVGTKVRKHFGQFGWLSGEITAIRKSENKYEILYEDDDDQSMDFDDPEMDEMVEHAKNDPPSTKTSGGKGKRKRAASAKKDASSKKNAPKFTVGTKVRKKFKGHGWFEGEIMSLNTKKGSYKVQYSDGDQEEFFFDEPEIDKLVEHAINNTGEGDDDDADDDEEVEEEQVEPAHQRRGNSWLPEEPLLSDTERGQLKGKTIDLDEMKEYLAKEWFLKANSASNVLLQVRRLMNGDGISNQNWPKDAVFKPKSVADLSEDYFQILQDSMSHEEKFGKIATKKLRNPLIKLVFYQEYVYKKNFSNLPSSSKAATPKANTSGKEPEGEVPDDGSVDEMKVQADPMLTDEQRSKLKGKKFDMDDFKKYLGKEWFITSKNSLMGASSRVKKLMNGDGIAYKHWPEGVEFRADPFVDLSANFFDMKQKAVAHEEKYGEIKGSTSLSNFMTRLVYYQHHLYEKDHGDSQENATSDDSKKQDTVKEIEASKDNEKKLQVQLHKPLLTDAQREQLKGTKIDLDALEKYLVDELDHDANFVKAVKSKVTRLMSGDGISYKNWDADFHPEALTDMSANLYQMQQDALAHEEKYGEDKSNGKVIRYPLYKLEMYQQYVYEKDFGSTEESAPLTEEQRKLLSGVELEMEDFEGFLGLNEDLKKGEAKKIVQQVKLLTGGKGVRCKEWDKAVIYQPPRTVDLSEDFGEMLEDANEYEVLYGEDKSGGHQLRIPINMLIKYQAYNYNTLNEKEETTKSKTAATASEGGTNGLKSKNEAPNDENDDDEVKEDSSNDDAGLEPPLTNEQLRVLKGDKIDMDDFEAFLVKKGGFPQVKRRVLVENVKRLVNGEGIPYKQGEKDAVFKCQRIPDLSVNLHKILQRAIKDEKKAGGNKNQAESDLQNPLRNFINYQRECYEGKKKKNGGKSTTGKPPTETKKDPKKDNAQDKGKNCMEVSESEAVV